MENRSGTWSAAAHTALAADARVPVLLQCMDIPVADAGLVTMVLAMVTVVLVGICTEVVLVDSSMAAAAAAAAAAGGSWEPYFTV